MTVQSSACRTHGLGLRRNLSVDLNSSSKAYRAGSQIWSLGRSGIDLGVWLLRHARGARGSLSGY